MNTGIRTIEQEGQIIEVEINHSYKYDEKKPVVISLMDFEKELSHIEEYFSLKFYVWNFYFSDITHSVTFRRFPEVKE